MNRSRSQKTVKKSKHWHKHGKHAAIPPHLRPEKKARPRTEQMYDTAAEAFAAARRKR